MTAQIDFHRAEKAEWWGDGVFYFVALASIALLFPLWEWLRSVLTTMIVVSAGGAVLITVITRIYMTRGNSLLRATQLSNSLGAGIGADPRPDYFNNSLAPSLARLGLTTLENTYFTIAVLDRMLFRERIWTGGFLALFLAILVYRQSSLELLILVSQTVFSADLVLAWYQLERYRGRTEVVRKRLYDFFLHGSTADSPNRVALLFAAFAEYECAKDEASRTLNSDDFRAINPIVTQEWEEVKKSLKVPVAP